jgi:hypothetical protein
VFCDDTYYSTDQHKATPPAPECQEGASSQQRGLHVYHGADEENTPRTEGTDSAHVLLSIVLAWIFTEVIPPLIATCFYVTEGEGTGSRVLFYRKQEWEVLRAIGESQMGSHFVKVRNKFLKYLSKFNEVLNDLNDYFRWRSLMMITHWG